MAHVTYLLINACKYKYERVEKLHFPLEKGSTVKSKTFGVIWGDLGTVWSGLRMQNNGVL